MLTVTFDERYSPETSVILLLCGTGIVSCVILTCFHSVVVVVFTDADMAEKSPLKNSSSFDGAYYLFVCVVCLLIP